MSERSRRFTNLYLVGLVACLAFTIAAALLVGGGFEEQSATWWITFGSIVWAQVLTFGYFIYSCNQDDKIFPFNIVGTIFVFAYDISILFLAVLSFADLSATWLGLLHLTAFVLWLLAMLVYQGGAGVVKEITIADTASRQGYEQIVRRCDELLSLARMSTADESSAQVDALQSLRDELEYITSDNPSAGSSADSEVLAGLDKLSELLQSASDSGGSEADIAGKFDSQMRRVKVAISDRERLIISSRS